MVKLLNLTMTSGVIDAPQSCDYACENKPYRAHRCRKLQIKKPNPSCSTRCICLENRWCYSISGIQALPAQSQAAARRRLRPVAGQLLARLVLKMAKSCRLRSRLKIWGPLRSIAEQMERIRHARIGAQSVGFDFFINARCDVFLQAPVENHNLALFELAIERGLAFAKAGASGLFLPGLQDLSLIKEIVLRSALPINIMQGSGAIARQQLAEAGATRISHGPGPYALAMQHLKDAAALALR